MISYEGRNRRTVNLLKTMYFDHPEWTICGVSIMMATWMKYREEVEAIVLRHPRLFPGFKKGQFDFDFPNASPLYEFGRHTDAWGVVWNNIQRGLDSYVDVHPLADWSSFETWTPPDPHTQADFGPMPDWDKLRESFETAKKNGGVASGGYLAHGFFFMKLYYLRGFENLMLDLSSDDERIHRLIGHLERYNAEVVRKQIEAGMEYMNAGEDLGMQHALPISPTMWRKFVKPSYEATFGQCRDRDIPVYLHSDGHILEIIPDLADVGITVINPQIRANGLEGIRNVIKGKMAMNLDLDRQLFPFASDQEIVDHIEETYEALHLDEGGLMLSAECEPDVPLERIETICSTLERVCNPPLPDEV